MSICKKCAEGRHKRCADNGKDGQPKTDYRGCPCQHKTGPIVQEPATGTHGD